jgi:hypothetical protein
MRLRTHVFRRLLATFAAVLSAILFLGNVPALADTNTAVISGTVSVPAGVDVSSIYVNAQPQSFPGTWGGASVGSDGTYRIENLSAGSYIVSFSGEGAGMERQWYKNATSADSALAVQVADGQKVTGIDAALVQGAGIAGKVTVPAGIDVTGIYVTATTADSEYSQFTSVGVSSDGTYRVRGLSAGSYKLKFQGYNNGAITQWYNNAETFADATALDVARGQNLTGIDATLAKGGSISGKVTVPAGTDITNLRVSAFSGDSQSTESGSVQVNSDGSYQLTGLRAGSYKLQFSGYQSGALTQWYRNAATFGAATPVALAAGQELTDINATLVKGATISGKVTAPAGVDLGAVSVRVQPADPIDGFMPSFVQLSAEGTYRAAGLPAGSYTVEFSGYNSGALPQWYKNADSAAAATPVVVTEGQDFTGVDAMLVKGASISGKVTMPAGMDPSRAYVYATSESGLGTGEGSPVASDGSYKIGGLKAGSYKVQFSTFGTGALPQWYKNAASAASATSVTVAAGQDVTGIDATLAKGASISGTVSVPAGVTPSQVTVVAYFDDGRYAGNAMVTAAGTYRLEALAAGSYKLQFSGNSGALAQWYNNASSQETAQAVQAAAGQDISGINATLVKGASISGKVIVPAGTDASQISVSAYRDGQTPTYVASAQVATNGTYRLVGLEAGTYKIGFSGYNTDALPRWYKGSETLESATPVAVTAGQDVSGIDATLPKGGTISGKVTVPAGVSVSGISAVAFTGGADQTHVSTSYVRGDGTYKIAGLPTGSYKIQFTGNNSGAVNQWYSNGSSADAAVSVAVTAGQDVTGINIALAKGATIAGKVTVPAGVDPSNIGIHAETADAAAAYVAGSGVSTDGSYKLVGLPAGSYKVRFAGNNSGAVDQWYSNATTAGTATPVTLAASQDRTGVNATMVKGATISGQLTGLTEGSQYPVTVLDSAGKTVKEGYSNPGGTYSVTGLPTGSYRVAFNRSSGYSLAEAQFYQNLPESSGVSSATPVAVTAGQSASGKDAKLAKGGSLSGTVTDKAKALLPNAVVQAFTADGSKVTRSATTDAQGKFSITGLTSGQYLLAVTPPAAKSDLGKLYSGNVTGESSAVPVTATAGADKPAGELTYAVTTPAPVSDPKASIALDPAKPQEAAVQLDNSASTVSADYHVIVNGDLARAKVTVAAGHKTAVPLTSLAPKSTIEVRVYGDGKGTGTRLASATTPDAVPAPAPSFTDVASDNQFYKEISWLSSAGISTGWVATDGTRTFGPLLPVNRDAMAAFMYRLSGKPPFTPPAVSSFTDVATNNQFYREITWLASTGVTTGWVEPDGTKTYRPLQSVNRDAMAAFMYRLAGKPAFTAPAASPFKDVATDNQFYKEITWLASTGITTGWTAPDGSKTFAPLQAVNRDAMAAFMYRYNAKFPAK